MAKLTPIAVFILLLGAGSGLAGSPVEGFVFIHGAELKSAKVCLEDFEILDHPVTNREYKAFVDETGWSAPLHWAKNGIPAGKEEHPVIFVNRKDVAAFLQWLSRKEGRVCRLPTSHEFEYAARGGLKGKTYPWGDEDPHGKANYDVDGSRHFDRWEDYLQPARWGTKNGSGLYGMAGNVCQMTLTLPDPTVAQFKYRIEDPTDLETTAMGGSWARSQSYLKCGDRVGISHGIRHPDLGFRPVRQPVGSDWTVRPRHLCAVSLGEGKVQLSWSLLRDDSASTQFHVFRSQQRSHLGTRVTPEPVGGSTDFVDAGLMPGTRYQYYVRPVDASGKPGPRSEWIGITPTAQGDPTVMSFRPVRPPSAGGSAVPVFGDLDGDGALDCVIRLDNGNREMSQDPGFPVQLEAFASYGRSLWRKDLCRHDHCFGSANNVPFNVWDMDGDGRAEVITRLQLGDEVFVAILSGVSGQVLHKAPWPHMATDLSRSSTRIHLSIAYLDGRHPAVITQTGLYENEIFVAFDASLQPLWEFDSFKETSGSGGHKIEVADVDGDGRQEVFDGTTCLNPDGTLRWSIYKQHPDIVSIHDHLPDHPGLEVFYVVESNPHAGAYLVEAATGKILWKSNRDDDPQWSHGHMGWSANIWDELPGMECVATRAGHGDDNLILFSADGRRLQEHFPTGWTPLEWDGDSARELIRRTDFAVGDFDGRQIVPKAEGKPQVPQGSALVMVADLVGDFRDELVVAGATDKDALQISVITAVTPIQKRFLAPSRTLDYRLWLGRNLGGGYGSVYTQPLLEPAK